MTEEGKTLLLQLGIIMAVVLVFNLAVKGLLRKWKKSCERRGKIWLSAFAGALYAPLTCSVWIIALLTTISLIDEYFNEPALIPCTHFLLPMVGVAMLVWFGLRWKNNILAIIADQQKNEETRWLEAGKMDALNKLATLGIFFVGVLIFMEASDKSLTTLLALSGIGAAALGFASKEFIANFFGSLMIYLTKPFEVGDYIKIPSKGVEGTVIEIGWYLTRIHDLEKQPIFVPNSTFAETVLITPSRRSHRFVNETVGIRYRDMEAAKEIIQDIKKWCLSNPDIDQGERMMIHLAEFATSSVNIVVKVYTRTVDLSQFYAVREEVLFVIHDIIKKHGAEMAFPTTTIEMSPLPSENP